MNSAVVVFVGDKVLANFEDTAVTCSAFTGNLFLFFTKDSCIFLKNIWRVYYRLISVFVDSQLTGEYPGPRFY